MRFNLKLESPDADFENIETLKQITINKFVEYGLPITKIRSGRLKGKERGIYVYHPNGTEYYQNMREIVEKTDNRILYRRYKKSYRVGFITTESLCEFENMLEMVISEATVRKECFEKR